MVDDNRPTFPGGMSGKQGTAVPARVILTGAVLGFLFFAQFLSASNCQPEVRKSP